jgi:hypothetical protein
MSVAAAQQANNIDELATADRKAKRTSLGFCHHPHVYSLIVLEICQTAILSVEMMKLPISLLAVFLM